MYITVNVATMEPGSARLGMIVAYRNGAPLRIKDIGQAVSGPEDTKQAAWTNGERGVFLVVFKQPGANVIDIVDTIKQ